MEDIEKIRELIRMTIDGFNKIVTILMDSQVTVGEVMSFIAGQIYVWSKEHPDWVITTANLIMLLLEYYESDNIGAT